MIQRGGHVESVPACFLLADRGLTAIESNLGMFPYVTDVQTGEAAKRLGTTTQTVDSLISKKLLKARKQRRGKRFVWLVDEASLERFLRKHGRFNRSKPLRLEARVAIIEGEVAAVREALDKGGPGADVIGGSRAVERERDELRAEVRTLRDAHARIRDVMELQRQADTERASVIDHLTAAVAATERADDLRRTALEQLEEALAEALGPRHPGDLA